MELLSLELRGAIGVRKGMNKEEIKIDFENIFDSGLLAIVADNGRGKTTVIENLHYYRTLVSRAGNLADHFELKDSYRRIRSRHNGNIYEGIILIDGFTKKQEAYLYENGVPLNDGKLTTYDNAVVEIFGTQELFFSSVFSGQKARNIASRSQQERRALFYEIANLKRYEVYFEIAKEKLKSNENKLRERREEMNSILLQIEELADLEIDLHDADSKINSKKEIIAMLKQAIETADQKINEQKISEAQLREKSASQAEILKEIDTLTQGGVKKKEAHELNLQKLKTEKTERIHFIENDPNYSTAGYDAEIQNITEQLNALDSAQGKEAILEDIDSLIQKKSLEESLIKKYEQILGKKEEIEAGTKRLKELEEELKVISTKENELSQDFEKSIRSEQLALGALIPKGEELQSMQKFIDEKKLALQALQKDAERIESDYQLEISLLKEGANILDQVPCDKELGAQCLLLSNAVKSKNRIPEVEAKYKMNKEDIELKIDYMSVAINNKKIDYNALENSIKQEQAEIVQKYERQRGQITVKRDQLKIERLSAETETKKLKESNFEEQAKQLAEADSAIILANSKIDGFNQLLIEKNKALENIDKRNEQRKENLASKIQDIEEQIVRVSELKRITKETAENNFAEREQKLVDEYKVEIDKYRESILKLRTKLDPEISEKLVKIQEAITKLEEEKAHNKQLLEDNELSLFEVQREKNILEVKLESKNKLTEQVNELDKIITGIETEISDYSFICRAFDKTGIPVLEMENLSVEVTSIANELLSMFDNEFRVSLITNKETKDGKKQKEVFEINVIDEDGITELSNKSGGQQVWIELALSLAIMLALQKQGRAFGTIFIDEKDGALDTQNAYRYKAMVEEAHKQSGVNRTILITHRPLIYEQIDQKILIDENGLSFIKN